MSDVARLSPVLKLGLGSGRDFVVGDIHGMFHLVRDALEQVAFDPRMDRLFCLGDLVDRGPFSALADDGLRNPGVYAVRGNHEQMFLDCYQGGQLNAAALDFNVRHNGAAWWLKLPESARQAHLAAYARMPLAIEVQTQRGSVGMVHAEVPRGMGWATFLAKLEAGDRHTTQSALWGRTRLSQDDHDGVPGIDRLFSGHTILERVARWGNCYFLDTGAFQRMNGGDRGKLSVANLVAASNVLTAGPVRSGLLNLNVEPQQGPFGRYAKG